jgi:hypothetical protein
MYTLNLLEIAKFDLANANTFVTFWSQFYEDFTTVFGSEDRIDYSTELNLGRDLTEENVRRLLRWKDPMYLTQTILSGPNKGSDNPRVLRVLENLRSINHFRSGTITEEEARGIAKRIFPNGPIWQVFLLHIARPHTYPIADKNVFRTCSLHTGTEIKESWAGYRSYRDYFDKIASAMGISQTIANLSQLKQIDNALMVFGQFLRSYYRQPPISAVGSDPRTAA